MPPWKLRTIRDQARGWSDAGIARAIRAVARADADIKGAASDASYTLERLVLTDHRAPRPALRTRPADRRVRGAGTQKGAAPKGRRLECGGPQREAAFLAIADLRFAAWFLWMTPLDAALSSLRAAA